MQIIFQLHLLSYCRQGSKRKRNVYTVYLDPEPVQAKQKSQYGPKKKRARLASKRKTKAEGKESIDALIAAFLASDAPVTCTAPVTTTHRKSRKTWRSYTNTPQDSVDSGLESGSFEGNDGTSGGGSGGSNSGDNSMSGGGSSGGGGGGGCGGGGGGKDGDSQKDQEPIIISDGETSEDEEQTSDEEMAQDTDKQVPQVRFVVMFWMMGINLCIYSCWLAGYCRNCWEHYHLLMVQCNFGKSSKRKYYLTLPACLLLDHTMLKWTPQPSQNQAIGGLPSCLLEIFLRRLTWNWVTSVEANRSITLVLSQVDCMTCGFAVGMWSGN